MAAVTRRSYAGAAPACTLTSSITSGDTTASLTGTVTAWPTTAGGPFHMVIDPGLSTEEKVLVGSRSTGSLSSITRGVDGTSASSHSAGATCYPVFTATDADEANTLASTLTTRGDLLTMGSGPTVARIAVGGANTILRSDGTDAAWASLSTAGIAPVASPNFTGTPTAPTAAVGTSTTQIATTEFVMANAEDDQFILAGQIFG